MRLVNVSEFLSGDFGVYEQGARIGVDYYKEVPEYLLEKYLILRMVATYTTVPNVGRRTSEWQFQIYLEE